MSFPDYYAILGVPPSADIGEIKAAFRALAKKYHPDKALDNPFAPSHFTQIREAYETLAHPLHRAKYDEELWLRGLRRRSKTAVRITPEWILGEAMRLRKHMATIDTYHMNQEALRDYVLALLRDEHLSVLSDRQQTAGDIAAAIFDSTKHLNHRYTAALGTRLHLLAGDDETLKERIAAWSSARQRAHDWNRLGPVIVLAFSLIIAFLIWKVR